MSEYYAQWGHMYLIHFGSWAAASIGAHIAKFGLPHPKKIPMMLLSSVILASVVAVFSSHAHSHYLTHFVAK